MSGDVASKTTSPLKPDGGGGDIMSGLMEGGSIGSMGMPAGGMVMTGQQQQNATNNAGPPGAGSVLAQALQKELPLQSGNQPGMGGGPMMGPRGPLGGGGVGGGMMGRGVGGMALGSGVSGPPGGMPGPRPGMRMSKYRQLSDILKVWK